MFSISYQNFEAKPQRSEIKSLKFNVQDLTIDELCECIKSGKVMCNVFNYHGDEMSLSAKRDYNFALSQCVMIDIDGDVDENLYDFVDKLRLKPTISYTTYSHQKDGKGNRYRLLYLFNDSITHLRTHSNLYDRIVESNGLSLSDNCGRSGSQLFFGSNQDCSMYVCQGATYVVSDIIGDGQKCNSNSIIVEGQNIIQTELHFHGDEFLRDFNTLSYAKLLDKYRATYPMFDSTPLPEVDVNQPTIPLPSDYITIKRRTYKEPIYDENGDVRTYNVGVLKLKNGEHRRKHLYLNALLRRQMKPDIDFNYLLYCLTYELYYFVWNNDANDKITKQQLKEIAERAMQTDLTKYQSYFEKHRDTRKCIANPDFCALYDVKPSAAVNYSRSVQGRERFVELYDPDISQAENLKRMNAAGIKMSLRTLKTRCKELGLARYKKSSNAKNPE